MTPEEAVVPVLKAVCPLVYPDVPPQPMPTEPFLVYQGVGGEVVDFLESEPADRNNATVEVLTWARDRLTASRLALQVQAAMTRAAWPIQARPRGAPSSRHESDLGLFGHQQYFSVWYPA